MHPSSIIVIFLFILFAFSNLTSYTQNIKWPETWTPDMSLKISSCCGLRPDSKTIFISTNNSYLDENSSERPNQHMIVSFTEIELKELLSVLKKNNVANLKSNPSKNPASDKETYSIEFSHDGKSYASSISPTQELNPNARKHFDTIIEYVDKLIEQKRATAKINFVFKFDKSIINCGKNVLIKIENPPTDFAFKASSIPSSAVIDLVPGEYTLNVKLVDPEKHEASAEETNFAEASIKINTQEIRQITLFLEGQLLKYK